MAFSTDATIKVIRCFAKSARSSQADSGEGESTTLQRRVSLLSHAPGLLLSLIVIADLGQFTDPDLWGHVRFGQAMLAAHRVVRQDIYSYSALGQPWHDHEWLSEVLMALFYNVLGVVGLKLWKAACATATILFAASGLAETGASIVVQLALLGIAASALMPQIQFRPQIFTFALFAAELAMLARDNYRRPVRLWLIVPMMALWANLHGGFIVGIASLGVYAAVGTAQDLIGGEGAGRAVQLGLVTAAAALATWLTPFGVETWDPVVHALRNPATRIVIADWLPLTHVIAAQWRHNYAIAYLYVLGLMAAFAVSFALTPRGDDLPLVAIALMMSVAALVAVRNMPLAVIACILPAARHIGLLMASRPELSEVRVARTEDLSSNSAMKQWAAVAIAAAAAAYAGIVSSRLATDSPYPSGAVAFMQRHNLKGNVLGDFSWGEYLIWHIGPPSKVFIDGRYDTVFSGEIINDYINFQFGLPQARKTLESYPHDFVLIPPGGRAYSLIASDREWQVVYRDASSVLFARSGSPPTKISGTGAPGAAPPGCLP